MKRFASILWMVFCTTQGCGAAYERWNNSATGTPVGTVRSSGSSAGFGLYRSQENTVEGGREAADHCVDQHLRVEQARGGRVTVANPVGECDNMVTHSIPQSPGVYPIGWHGAGMIAPGQVWQAPGVVTSGVPVRWKPQ